MSETALKRAIVEALHACGAWAWVVNSGVIRKGARVIRLAPEGMPDICGIIAPTGRWFGLEVKKPKGSRFEPKQRETQAKLNAAGAFVATVRSVEEAVNQYRAACAEEQRRSA